MNIIKKNKKIFLGILIGTLFSGVGVYAATTYLASDVTYTPSNTNWGVNNVKSALDDLYTKNSLSDTSEYLTNYIASNYTCSTCGGTATKPTLSISNNTATMSMTSASTSQGNIYLEISDISKYKYLVLKVQGSGKGIRAGLTSDFKSKYELEKVNSLLYYADASRSFDATLYIDVSDLSGKYFLVIDGTYINSTKITTQAILK